MQIRTATLDDLDALAEIDGTIESTHYLHLEQSGEGLNQSWRLEQRPLREKLIEANRLSDDVAFVAKQILSNAQEGAVLVAEHEARVVAALVAQRDDEAGTMQILDLRVDYDVRREGLALAMVYQIIQQAREAELRAVDMVKEAATVFWYAALD